MAFRKVDGHFILADLYAEDTRTIFEVKAGEVPDSLEFQIQAERLFALRKRRLIRDVVYINLPYKGKFSSQISQSLI